jgi:dienelactone hydrolase
MDRQYQHLGVFSDWVEEARRQGPLYPLASPGPETQRLVRQALGFCSGPETPLDVRVEGRWERNGLLGEELSWWVGYGPRTRAYLLRPALSHGPLPGILALHDHGGFKFFGKEKIADGPENPPKVIVDFRDGGYGGRAWANALAREGFVVLVHDTFLWGSRKFPLEEMPPGIRQNAAAIMQSGLSASSLPAESQPEEVRLYNQAAAEHEHLVAKYCNLLGTCMAGVVCHEDRIAVNYLLSRPEIDPEKIGCAGLSGGGNRSALLQATHEWIRAAVVVGLMSTYEATLDHNVFSHTWMLFPPYLARFGDWPDLAACRAPSPLLVQYDLDDELFTREGMYAAHERISGLYTGAGRPQAYTGQFYPGPHKFDLEMQAAAFQWLKAELG